MDDGVFSATRLTIKRSLLGFLLVHYLLVLWLLLLLGFLRLSILLFFVPSICEMSPKIPNAANLMSYLKEPQFNDVETLCLVYRQMQ